MQANPVGHTNQDWLVVVKRSSPKRHFALRNRKSGLCLGISGTSTDQHAPAAQFRCDHKANQLWSVRR
ncbi:RICIN domain-containing protein [Nonomuraea turcica]|uniref:RICIN domain-containing protein n=1 Tax=Nonomuraea sp. G32 TaxID=3067274 RepID=UPI0035303A95